MDTVTDGVIATAKTRNALQSLLSQVEAFLSYFIFV
jgi:hypothetical protein